MSKKEKITRSIRILKQLHEDSVKAVSEGKFPGINNFSGLVEYALTVVLKMEM